MTPVANYQRAGYPALIPYLLVKDAARLIEFMKTAFGAEEVGRYAGEDGSIMHAEVRIGDSLVEMADGGGQFAARPAAIHMYVPDADSVYSRAISAGATSLQAPVDQAYGDREAAIKDLSGNNWYIATHKGTSHVPEGLRPITPYLHVQGGDGMIAFLKDAFGGAIVERHASPEGQVLHAKVRLGDSMIELSDAHGPWQAMPCALHYYVPDTDAIYMQAIQAGASTLFEPVDKEYGERSGGVTDPFGNQWYIATPLTS